MLHHVLPARFQMALWIWNHLRALAREHLYLRAPGIVFSLILSWREVLENYSFGTCSPLMIPRNSPSYFETTQFFSNLQKFATMSLFHKLHGNSVLVNDFQYNSVWKSGHSVGFQGKQILISNLTSPLPSFLAIYFCSLVTKMWFSNADHLAVWQWGVMISYM